MSAAADTLQALRARLQAALVRRRAASWLLPLLPAAALAASGAHKAAAALAVAACVWAAADYQLWKRRIANRSTTWLNEAVPALEDSTALLAGAPATPMAQLQRNRLLARLADILGDEQITAIVTARVRHNAIPFALAAAAAAGAWAYGNAHDPQRTMRAAGPAEGKTAAAQAALALYAEPPAYTGAKPSEGAPRDLQVPQHTAIRWCANHADAVVELSDGQSLPVATGKCASWRATDTVFWRSKAKSSQRYTIRVTPDQAPQVNITAPTESVQVLKMDATSAQITVSATDDYAIVRASLHMTLARGSGENIRFSDREVPLPASTDPRKRNWSKQWQLKELGMEPGDELYFFVRATDNAPDQPHTTQSPTYTLRLPAPQGEALESTALPSMVKPENLRSQRQIIIDTEQLVADSPRLVAGELRSRSEKIASDQAKLRLRYGKFLGEESSLFGGDDDGDGDGHAGGHDAAPAAPGGFGTGNIAAQFGHAHDTEDNATIFDPQTKAILRRALSAMWDSEKALRAISPKTALPPEYKALEAIKELQQAERIYLHRTAFVPPALKEDKRMSGDMVGAQSYRRAQGAANDPVPAEVRELVQSLGGEGPLPPLWSKTAREAVARLGDEEQRLSALRAVQDVEDGCQPCRAPLRAWLRSTLSQAPLVLQAQPVAETRFTKALRAKEGQ